MLLKVAFDGPSWLVQIGNVVQLLYLFLIIVQVGLVEVGGWGAVVLVGRAASATLTGATPSVPASLPSPHTCPPSPCPPPPPCPPARLQLIINLKNKPEAVEKIHSFCAIYFCLYMLVFTGVSIRWALAGLVWGPGDPAETEAVPHWAGLGTAAAASLLGLSPCSPIPLPACLSLLCSPCLPAAS